MTSGYVIRAHGHVLTFGLKTKAAVKGDFETVEESTYQRVAERAILAERERCAEIAERLLYHDGGAYVAEVIRSGE